MVSVSRGDTPSGSRPGRSWIPLWDSTPLRFKLSAMAGLVLLALVFTTVISYRTTSANIESLDSIYEDQFEPTRRAASTHVALTAWNRAMLNHVLAENQTVMDIYERITFEQTNVVLQDLTDLLSGANLSEEGTVLLLSLQENFKESLIIQEQVLSLSRTGLQESARDLIRAELRPVIDLIDVTVDRFMLLKQAQLEATMEMVADTSNAARRAMLSVSIFTILSLAVFGYFLLSTITSNVNRVLVATRSLAEEHVEGIGSPPLEGGDELVYLAGFVDHIRETLEEHLRKKEAYESELRSKNEELEAYSHMIAHDLRAPVRHLSGFSKILEEEAGAQLEPNSREHLSKIQESAKRMGSMVDDLLSFSRLGRKGINRQVTDMSSLVAEVWDELVPETENPHVRLEVGHLPVVSCDPSLTKQVLTNLLTNAIRFTRTREKPLIQIGETEVSEGKAMFIRDNGLGFSQEHAAQIFEPFRRLHREKEFSGSGIGLSTVRRIVNKHGGRIWAEGELDRGATFYFTLGKESAEGTQE